MTSEAERAVATPLSIKLVSGITPFCVSERRPREAVTRQGHVFVITRIKYLRYFYIYFPIGRALFI